MEPGILPYLIEYISFPEETPISQSFPCRENRSAEAFCTIADKRHNPFKSLCDPRTDVLRILVYAKRCKATTIPTTNYNFGNNLVEDRLVNLLQLQKLFFLFLISIQTNADCAFHGQELFLSN